MEFIFEAFLQLQPTQIAMWLIGGLLIFLAIKKDIEPALLLPMGFGAILVNMPFSPVAADDGVLSLLFQWGIEAGEVMPLLLFIGIGAMIDFGPLLSNPKLFLLGAAAQTGVFATMLLASAVGFSVNDAAAVSSIAAADGPTAILVAQKLLSSYAAPITVAAYSYMALAPIVQTATVKVCTTKKERAIKMKYSSAQAPKLLKILFPVTVTVIAGLIAPQSLSLVGMLMFGNLLKECGVTKTLSDTAQTTLTNIITLLLGITVSFQMRAELFIRLETLVVMMLGVFGFCIDVAAGVLCAKIMNLFCKEKINPVIGAAGISAFPMASRVAEKIGVKEDPSNHLLMHAAGANVSGQIASAIVGGLLIGLIG